MPYTLAEIQQTLLKHVVIQDDDYHLWCGGERMRSPSSIISKLCPFPLYRVSENCAKTQDPENKYYGKSAEEIRWGWQENAQTAALRGRLNDTFMQSLWHGLKIEHLPIDDDVKTGALDFYNKFHKKLTVLGSECVIAYPKIGLAGRADMLCAMKFDNQISGLIIIDWKTNTSDILSTKQRMAKPANKFYNNVIDKASIQLAIYKLILEEGYGLHVSAVRTVLLGDKCTELDNELEKLETAYSRGDNWISFDSTIGIDNDGVEDLIKACF